MRALVGPLTGGSWVWVHQCCVAHYCAGTEPTQDAAMTAAARHVREHHAPAGTHRGDQS